MERYIVQLLKHQSKLHKLLEPIVPHPPRRQALINAASQLANRWPRLGASLKRTLLNQLTERIDIGFAPIDLKIHPNRLPDILEGDEDFEEHISSIEAKTDGKHGSNISYSQDRNCNEPVEKPPDTLTISLPAKIKRAGLETKLVIDADYSGSKDSYSLKAPDQHLQKHIAKAHDFQAIFLRGGQSISAMAEEAGVSGSYFTRTLKYSFLAQDIIRTIQTGRQPVQLTSRKLRLQTSIPTCWDAQRRLLEFV